MPTRSDSEIKTEIAALKACKLYIPKGTKFGEDNLRVMDLQIEELRDGIDATTEEWDAYLDREQEFITEARNWKEGESDESPSSGWDLYKPKQ